MEFRGVSDSFKTLISVVRSVSGMTPKLDCVGLVVKDMGASLAFYRRLGLDIPLESDNAPHAEAPLPGGMRFMWDTIDTVRSFDPDFNLPEGGVSGFAFVCESPAEVDKVHQGLVDAGYRSHRAPWDAFWGQRYASIKDPDGYVVDLFAPL
jgi:catechol 2,3-dioxygenase-like lactoylglutathione lyase family enzyme